MPPDLLIFGFVVSIILSAFGAAALVHDDTVIDQTEDE